MPTPGYRTLRPVVAHGRCSVFECERDDGTVFVLKQLTASSNEIARERFEREIRLGSTVSHPNVVPIVDVEPGPAPTWFVMPRYECSLAERLGVIRGNRDATHHIFTSLLRGVARLHWHSIVHRDLKPDNVLLGTRVQNGGAWPAAMEYRDWTVVVADFGVSRELESARRVTLVGQLLGTDFYMAPEVRAHGASRADYRSDIFALGGILNALHTGQPSAERRDSREGPAVSYDMLRVINKARAWVPERRYQSVSELQRAWRLAVLNEHVQHHVAGSAVTVADDLRRRGVAADDLAAIASLVQWPALTREHVFHAIAGVEPRTIDIVAQWNVTFARQLLRVFVDHVDADVSAGDAQSIVGHCASLAHEVRDAECAGIVAAALLSMGYQHNESHATDAFCSIVSAANEVARLDAVRGALLDMDPAHVMPAALALRGRPLPLAAREVLAST